jgi:transcriptional regulator with GAF, ATPase, and Fis domain
MPAARGADLPRAGADGRGFAAMRHEIRISDSATSVQASTEDRLAFERLLADLSARFANVPDDIVETEIADAQQQLIAFLGFDRSSFAEFTADGWIDVISAVARDGVEPHPRGPVPKIFGWYVNEIRSGRLVVIRSLDDLPAEARDVAEYLRTYGVRSHIGIPLSIGGRVVALIAFAAFHATRPWPEDSIRRLKIVGEVFSQTLARKRESHKLKEALEENRRLKERLEKENAYLRQNAQVRSVHGLASRSPRFKTTIEQVRQVAPTEATVLLLGETGTGKEVLAQAIHDLTSRRDRPMIKVSCAALPSTLIDAELFGREKGAYTGALARQAGRFEIAHGSTIFLDEIGELPLDLQPKLLRVLQEGEFERVGSTRTIKVDARVIAATNRQLSRAVAEGRFREDLFYRLNVFPIDVPPLRDRREDIEMLAWAFIKEFSQSIGKPIERIADQSLAAMQAYPWPGNIRELRNMVERAIILARGPTLHLTLSAEQLLSPKPAPTHETLGQTERAHIKEMLERCGWRIRGAGGAAERLGIKPTTLESRMKKLGVARPG